MQLFKINIMYVRFIPADGCNCCNNIFTAVHHYLSISHPQTFGLFAVFYYHKAGRNTLKHMCRRVSMPQSGVAGSGVHTSSTSLDTKLLSKVVAAVGIPTSRESVFQWRQASQSLNSVRVKLVPML